MTQTIFEVAFAFLSAWWVIDYFLSIKRMRHVAQMFIETDEHVWLMHYLEHSKWHSINFALAIFGGVYLVIFTGLGHALFG